LELGTMYIMQTGKDRKYDKIYQKTDCHELLSKSAVQLWVFAGFTYFL